MRPDTQLDYAIFQLTPTRTRCELYVAAQGLTYKLASGLLKPFVAHLGAAEEQIARGGYSIRLEPPDPGSAAWFTKGTMERFVRFVSTPEVLERVSTVEMELIELQETIRVQANDALEETQTAEDQPSKMAPSRDSTGGISLAPANLDKPAKAPEALDGAENKMEENTKQRLLRALDARRMMLQKEQGMSFARAIAAGFSIEHMEDLVLFAESFGATRLREACIKFIALCKKRQESGLWQEDLDLAAAETAQADMAFMGGVSENVMNYVRSREHPDAWPDMQGRENRRASFPNEGKLSMGEDGLEKLTRRGSLDELTGEFWQVAARMRSSGMMGGFNADYNPLTWPKSRQTPTGGRNQLAPEEMQAVGVGYLEGNGEYTDLETGRGPGLVRGHPFMPAWQGQSQNQYMQNIHPHSPHESTHPSLPSSFGFSRPPQPGLPYPQYLGNAYMQTPYAEINAWQMHAPLPPQYWPGNQGYNDTPRPTANEHVDGILPIPQHREAELFQSLPRELHGMEPTPIHEHPEPEPIQSLARELHGMEPTSIYRPASKAPVSEDVQETVDSQKSTRSSDDQDHDNHDKLSHEVDTETPAETTRRLPRRSSSPSRRSASPMRKVQIGRSGSRRSGMVVIRNINYIARNTQDQHNREGNGTESSGSWSEDGEEGNSDEEERVQVKAVPVRVRVQDVIGLFESKKEDINDVKDQPSKKESKRLSSKNSVLSRWADSGASGRDTSEVEASFIVDRIRRGVSNASAHDVAEMESKQPNVIEKEPLREVKSGQIVGDMLLLPERKGASRSADVHGNEMFGEQGQQERKKISMVDDSFIVPDSRTSLSARDRRTLDADFELASKVSGHPEQQLSDDSFIVFDLPVAREEAKLGWRMPLNLESEMPTDQNLDASKNKSAQRSEIFEPDDLFMFPDRSKDTASRSWNTPVDYDMQVLAADMMDDPQHGQEKQSVAVDEEFPSESGVNEREDGESGGKSKATSSKKVSELEVKAKAMQEMLERRRVAAGSRSGKPNPLADAQLRAEKLRAYKAGLQKSKKEKEEEDRKRIEDLKNQRRERIAARSSPGGGAAAQSPSAKRAPQTPPLNASRSSTTAVPQKLSSSSPRSSINGANASLSPNVARAKASSGNKPPRTSPRTPKASENAVSRSVPSLSELRKESLKTTLCVRASTGSQRLSQLKKNIKDVDSVSALKANGHMEEKKRPLPLTTVRKGIPPAKDTKGEISPLVKSSKVPTLATKQKKKIANAAGAVKPSFPKGPVLETGEVAAATEQVSAANVSAVEVSVLPQETEAEVDDNQEINVKTTEVEDSPPVGGHITEQDNGYAQIRAPASNKLEITGSTGDAVCLTDEEKHELATSDEALKVLEQSQEAASNMGPSFHADSLVRSDGEQAVVGGGPNAGEDYHAPIAHVSSRDDNSPTCKESDAIKNDGPHVPIELPNTSLSEQYNPPYAPPSESPLLTPSKNLPRLHEAIQQAHSPEANPGVSRSRKKSGDSGSQKTSKDHHAKGLKRLLLLGRKSSRSSNQNSADWVSVSMTSEVDEDGDEVMDMPSSNDKNVGIGSIVNMDGIRDRAGSPLPGPSHVKLQGNSTSGSSSSKGRSFFSLSTFRGKSEGKAT